MKIANLIGLGLVVWSLSACATNPKSSTSSETFSVEETAKLTATYFGLERSETARALQPTFKKYGEPHIYISGLMSSLADPEYSRLYGTGSSRQKRYRPQNLFWKIEGEELVGHMRPIKTAHLVYNKSDIEALEHALSSLGSLSRRGRIFTVFERQADEQIVVTVHRSDDLPPAATFETIAFSTF